MVADVADWDVTCSDEGTGTLTESSWTAFSETVGVSVLWEGGLGFEVVGGSSVLDGSTSGFLSISIASAFSATGGFAGSSLEAWVAGVIDFRRSVTSTTGNGCPREDLRTGSSGVVLVVGLGSGSGSGSFSLDVSCVLSPSAVGSALVFPSAVVSSLALSSGLSD